MKRHVDTLTNTELAFARQVKRAGLATYYQAVKALERREHELIAAWLRELAQTEAPNDGS